MTLHLQPGISPAEEAKQLRECATRARQVVAVTGGVDVVALQHDYLNWAVIDAGPRLRHVFREPGILQDLQGTAYWEIRNLDRASARPAELIRLEAEYQAAKLEDLADQLARWAARLEAAPGKMTVVDTNILLHFDPPSQVNWAGIVGVAQVRLVLPLRVVEELDLQKYTARQEKIANRAARRLRRLWVLLEPTAGAPVELSPGVTIEVPVDDERHRTLDADQEVLDLCGDLRAVGMDPILVTGDTGMALRASALNLQVRRMPDKHRLLRPEQEGSDL